MDTFQSIVLRGHVRNTEDRIDPNAAASALELIPNSSIESPIPVTFSIKFITDGIMIEYKFSADLGTFLDVDYHRRIVSEELFLMNGFKSMFSAKLVAIISEWLDQKFMVIYRADAMQLIRKFSDPKKKSVYIEKTLNECSVVVKQ